MNNYDILLSTTALFRELTKFAKETQYVYHIKSDKFKGKFIYPLEELKIIYPDIYKKEISKYKGREAHPNTKIKLLDCQWKDCVNFSTINPIKIFELEELLGIKTENAEIFRFKISDLSKLDFCLYDDDISPKKEEAYSQITISSYKETQFIPNKTVKYFIECKEKKENPLLFAYIKHLIVNSKIDILKADIIKWKSNI